MITKKELIGNELFREIIRIRVDALAKLLELQKKDRLPKSSRTTRIGPALSPSPWTRNGT